MNTGLRLRRVEQEFGLAIFLLHRVVRRDRDLSKGLMITRSPITKDSVVRAIGENREGKARQAACEGESLQQMLDSRAWYWSHGVHYTWPVRYGLWLPGYALRQIWHRCR